MTPRRFAVPSLLTFVLSFCCLSVTDADSIHVVKSVQSGDWSSTDTWASGHIPTTGDQVVIRSGHHVRYDIESSVVIRLVQIAGTLEFATDKSTRLDVGLLTVTDLETPMEEGFDCHVMPRPLEPGKSRPALIVGRPEAPVAKDCTALIRLHFIEGMDQDSCPGILCCGGRMDFHGQPIERTWVKLSGEAEAGDTTLALASPVPDWKPGDHIIVTGTKRPRNGLQVGGEYYSTIQTEENLVAGTVSRMPSGGDRLQLDHPLEFSHFASEDYQAEAANLSRNVIVESADPNGVRGHTMYHRHSAGSISYAEFRHLGKKDLLGRYSLHFHLVGDTMRGSSIIGASIWDSDNRWVVIHGTSYLTVRDCVGYKSIGHGYFLEDGTENYNVLDHNLAVAVAGGKPLPKQVFSFDPNRGAGFWWGNCQNSFTRNVAADCIEYGFRFDNKQTEDFDPHLPVLQADGTYQTVDTRILPFIRFEDNEAHTMKFFSLSLRGFSRPEKGLDIYAQANDLAVEAAAAIPERGHPFWIRDFKTWEAHWGSHFGTAGVFLDGYDCFRADVGIWRSIMEGSGFRRLHMSEMRVNDIHMPLGMPSLQGERSRHHAGLSSFRDDLPPATMVTQAFLDGGLLRVQGSTADSSDIKSVMVNGKPANSIRGSFAEWEIVLDAPPEERWEVNAFAEDVVGNVELRPHFLVVDPTGFSTTAASNSVGAANSTSHVHHMSSSSTTGSDSDHPGHH